jgi:ADP-ribose pyrophosphatase YjhB (NUDIX family)
MSNNTILQVGVKVLIENKHSEVLLVRRAVKKYGKTNGSWDIPGGRIDPCTSLLENLAREVREETALELCGTPHLLSAQDIFVGEGEKHVVRLTYIGQAKEGEIVLDTEENTEYVWVSRADLPDHEDLDVYLHEVVQSKL